MKKIVITIPAFNEEKTLSNVFKEVKSVMDKTKYTYEIHILDDGSTDKTAEIAKQLTPYVSILSYNVGEK